MRKLGAMLKPALGRDEVLRAARAQRALKDWSKIVGESMASRSHPDRYDHGTVWISVQGSAWAQELRMRKDEILARLEEHCREPGLFTNLRFGVRPLPEAVEVEEPKPVVPKPDTTGLGIREIAERRLKNWPRDPDPS